MVHRCDINIDGINGTTQPCERIYHNNTKCVHVGKIVATKFSAKHVYSRETNNTHSIITPI